MPHAEYAASEIHSYILRLWAEGEPPARIWRVSLTCITDGERRGFADLEAAFRFLKEQVGERMEKDDE